MPKIPEGDGVAVPFSLALAALGWLAACTPPQDPGVLASWAGGTVTVEQLDAHVRELSAQRRRPAAGESLAEWVEARIADIALPSIVLDRARGSELASSPALALRARFEANQEIGRNHLFDLCPAEEPSLEELRATFDSTATTDPRPWILVRHIYKRALPELPASERAAVRAEIERLRAEIEDGVSFVELARAHSDSETAKEGGLLGRISREAPMEASVLAAAWALRDGEHSGIVEVDNGFHLLLREQSGVEPASTFEQLREELARRETLRRREACGREILNALGEATPIVVDREAMLESEDLSRPALSIGEESFTAEQLAGLSSEDEPIALKARRGELLRRFAESVLLVRDAVAADAAIAKRHAELEARALDEALVEARWRQERRALVAGREEAELRAYFEAHRDRFHTDLELDAGLILISAADAAGRRGALERTLNLRRRIDAGESFEQLAAVASDHVSRAEGGRLGAQELPRLRVVLGSRGIATATELSVGEISEPVRIHDQPVAAFGLIKLYGRTEPRPRTFEEAREAVVDTLSGESVRRLDRELREHLLDESGIVLHERSIAEYVAGIRG